MSGEARAGQTLTATAGGWVGSPTSYSYQWLSCDAFGDNCQSIAGATASSYVPPAEAAGHALAVTVTAANSSSTASRTSLVTQPVSPVAAPDLEAQPTISGTPLAGQTLTGGPGKWSGAQELRYQWQRCSETACSAIARATSATYTLGSEDLASKLRLLVTAVGATATTTAVSERSPAVEPATPTAIVQPSVLGTALPGGVIGADPGIWSGSGQLIYAYAWEHCTSGGSECAPVEGASEDSYLLSSSPSGSYRFKVTVSSSAGRAEARSPLAPAAAGGEVTAEQAAAITQATDASLLAPSTRVSLRGSSIAPALTDGEEITSSESFTPVAVSKEHPGEFAVDSPEGDIALAPSEPSAAATVPPTLLNGGAAVLFANTGPAANTIIRAEPQGAAAFLQLRSPEAPRSFSWTLALGSGQSAYQAPNGTVIVAASPPSLSGPSPRETPEHETAEGEAETPAEASEREHSEAEDEQPVELPKAPAALTGKTAGGEGAAGMPQPQDTQITDEAAASTMAQAESETGGKALIAIAPPTVVESKGHAVPATLKLTGETITLTITPGAEASYPLLAALTVAAPTEAESEEKDPFEYGIAGTSLHGNFTGNFNGIKPFDPRLKTGSLEIKTARTFIPWNIALHGQATTANEFRLWLKAVHSDGLEPMVTLGTSTSHKNPVSASEYRQGVKAAMELFRGQVTKWGAWNEPDFNREDKQAAKRAAEFWEAAESANLETHCGCTIVAGEFLEYASELHIDYVKHYISEILYGGFCSECWDKDRREWTRHRYPRVWGLHDYYDVVEYLNNHGDHAKVANAFVTLIANSKLQKPEVWITEAGVALNDGNSAHTTLLEPSDEALSVTRQTQAAKEFLNLRYAEAPREPHHIGRVYYYEYLAPSEEEVVKKKEKEKYEFDSGMVEERAGDHGLAGFNGDPRPAYCVLNYSTHICPPEIETTPPTGHNDAEAVAKAYGQAATVEFTVRRYNGETEHFTKHIGLDVYAPVQLGADEQGCPGEYSYTTTIVTADGEHAQAAHEIHESKACT